jgi:hypothetical protein
VAGAVKRSTSETQIHSVTRSECVDGDVVSSYVDEWKRTALEPSKRSSRRNSRPALPRTSPLDGLISVEDENGDRQVARGFSKRAVELAQVHWKCSLADADECSVCLAYPEQALRLPCNHV